MCLGRDCLAACPRLGGEPYLVVLDVIAAHAGDAVQPGVSDHPAGQLPQRVLRSRDTGRGKEHAQPLQVPLDRCRRLRRCGPDLRPLPGRDPAGRRPAGGRRASGQRAHRGHLLHRQHLGDSRGIGVDQRSGAAVLPGQPAVGQVQVDPGRLDRGVPGLGLHRLQRHPGLPQPGQARVPQLMAGRVLQPGPAAGAGQDLIQPLRRQRQAAPRPLQHHEHPVRRRRGPLVMQVRAQRVEEPVRGRDHPVMAALALHHGQPPVSDLHILKAQPQHLAPAQPGQQHRQHHRPVPVRAQRGDQPVRLVRRQDPRQGPRHPDQRRGPRPVRPARPPGQQAARHRVGLHRRIPPGDQVRIQSRHRRQAPGDRPRRQPRLPVR